MDLAALATEVEQGEMPASEIARMIRKATPNCEHMTEYGCELLGICENDPVLEYDKEPF